MLVESVNQFLWEELCRTQYSLKYFSKSYRTSDRLENLNYLLSFQTSISAVEQSIEAVKMHQSHSRMNVIKDWYLITGNESYVVRWSIIQIAIIVTASAFQVYFVRRLFRVSNVTPTAKPRA